MDRNDAIRIVIFEYLLPAQRKATADALYAIIQDNRWVVPSEKEHTFAGLMEHIKLFADGLLSSRGHATSFVYRYNRLHHHDCTSLTVRAIIVPSIDMHQTFERNANPPGGWYMFKR